MLKSTLTLMLLVCSLLPSPALAAPQEIKPTVIQQSVNSRIRCGKSTRAQPSVSPRLTLANRHWSPSF
jgi:hypothetical protein